MKYNADLPVSYSDTGCDPLVLRFLVVVGSLGCYPAGTFAFFFRTPFCGRVLHSA